MLKECAQFSEDYLWQKPDGTLTAAPSTSPEHGPVDEGTTFTHAVIRENLQEAVRAAMILGVDNSDVARGTTRLRIWRLTRWGATGSCKNGVKTSTIRTTITGM